MPAIVALLVLTATGAACAGPAQPIATSSSRESTRTMSASSLQIIQGTTATHGETRLGFVDSDGPDGAWLNAWTEQDPAWLSHWRLRTGQVFPAGAGFLQVQAVQHDGPRAVLVLDASGDTGSIAAPAAHQPILPLGGSLDMGLTRIELVAAPADGKARARLWPKLYPLAKTAAEDIREVDLVPGVVLEFGTRTLQVDRIQADAGDIAAFVVFSTQP